MKIFYISKFKIYIIFSLFLLLLISSLYYVFAKENSIQVPYFSQENIYSSSEKIAYLTFDDGPNNTITPKVLDILDKLQVKANFFVIGKQVTKYPKVVSTIYKSGHFIGNHGYSHNNNA